jgi:hypothetical protein
MAVIVKKSGEKMNSPHPYRRNLYLHIEPVRESPIETLKNAANEIRILLVQWDFVPRLWWINHKECKYCRTRQEYENLKWVSGEWVWNRYCCMRHYLVSHFIELSQETIESNRFVEFSISKQQITVKIATNNYDYDVTILRSHATLACNYKGNKYIFTYNNHTNALPYASTYFVLLNAARNIMRRFSAYLAHLAYGANTWYNVYVNNVKVCEAGGGQQ